MIRKYEEFENNLIFYKLVDGHLINKIMKDGLIPNRLGGTWLISEDYLDEWLDPNNLFGSLLQALIYFPSKKESTIYLLKVEVRPDILKVRNVDLMLKDIKKWKSSLKEISSLESDYKIKEYLLMGKVSPEKISIVHKFKANSDLSKYKVDPVELKNYIFNGSPYTLGERMSTISLISKYIWLKLKNLIN